MKHTAHSLLTMFVLSLVLACTSQAHEKNVGGPNGGRLLTAIEPHAEFLLLPDRKVQITFVNDDGAAIAPFGQVVTVTTGERLKPTRLYFTAAGNSLVSNQAVPAGDDLPVIVQIKPSATAKTIVERFHLNLSVCGDCKRAEYACICDH